MPGFFDRIFGLEEFERQQAKKDNSDRRQTSSDLHKALRAGNYKNAKEALDRRLGVDSTVKDPEHGTTLLQAACIAGYKDIVESLHEKFPSMIHQKDKKGRTALHILAEQEEREHTKDKNILSRDAAIKWLIKKGLDINVKCDQGYTARTPDSQKAYEAICLNQQDTVREILSKSVLGVDTEFRSESGLTLFLAATLRGYVDLMDKLQKQDNSVIHQVDRSGNTALHLTVMKDEENSDLTSYTVTKWLITNGIEVNAKSQTGEHTALDLVKALIPTNFNNHPLNKIKSLLQQSNAASSGPAYDFQHPEFPEMKELDWYVVPIHSTPALSDDSIPNTIETDGPFNPPADAELRGLYQSTSSRGNLTHSQRSWDLREVFPSQTGFIEALLESQEKTGLETPSEAPTQQSGFNTDGYDKLSELGAPPSQSDGFSEIEVEPNDASCSTPSQTTRTRRSFIGTPFGTDQTPGTMHPQRRGASSGLFEREGSGDSNLTAQEPQTPSSEPPTPGHEGYEGEWSRFQTKPTYPNYT